jgi:hypothetical protein
MTAPLTVKRPTLLVFIYDGLKLIRLVIPAQTFTHTSNETSLSTPKPSNLGLQVGSIGWTEDSVEPHLTSVRAHRQAGCDLVPIDDGLPV